jgi:hypothetical protein
MARLITDIYPHYIIFLGLIPQRIQELLLLIVIHKERPVHDVDPYLAELWHLFSRKNGLIVMCTEPEGSEGGWWVRRSRVMVNINMYHLKDWEVATRLRQGPPENSA